MEIQINKHNKCVNEMWHNKIKQNINNNERVQTELALDDFVRIIFSSIWFEDSFVHFILSNANENWRCQTKQQQQQQCKHMS